MSPADARTLLATGQTVYLADFGTGPVLTTRIPCGQTPRYSLGRYPPDAMPTDDELAEDLLAGRQQLARMARKTVAA